MGTKTGYEYLTPDEVTSIVTRLRELNIKSSIVSIRIGKSHSWLSSVLKRKCSIRHTARTRLLNYLNSIGIQKPVVVSEDIANNLKSRLDALGIEKIKWVFKSLKYDWYNPDNKISKIFPPTDHLRYPVQPELIKAIEDLINYAETHDFIGLYKKVIRTIESNFGRFKKNPGKKEKELKEFDNEEIDGDIVEQENFKREEEVIKKSESIAIIHTPTTTIDTFSLYLKDLEQRLLDVENKLIDNDKSSLVKEITDLVFKRLRESIGG